MPSRPEDAQILAEHVGRIMLEKDESARFLGVTLDGIGPGFAQMSMTVTRSMLNALDLCHGGFTFKLADDAFAYACNSHNRNAVGLSCTISYPAAAREGDRLTATCREVHRKGRNGTYDVTVTKQDGEVVALFRGQCRVIDGHIVE
ncbi:MAG: hydroxyphenylacetyl-CoA thioesterase PaaI [Rhodospirillaceae bacterium]|nr:hydroxyphenylacetyl-CoA thioesterase PaaI [Rhodospirillales bacterium]